MLLLEGGILKKDAFHIPELGFTIGVYLPHGHTKLILGETLLEQ